MDAKAQVDAARRTCLAIPRSDLAVLVVTGEDRVSWLNGLLTCDMMKHAPDAAVYGLAVGRTGRVLADAIVVFDDNASRVLVVIPRSVADSLRAHFDHYLVMEDAEMATGTDAFDVWALHGPRAGEGLEAARASGARGGVVDLTGLGGAVVLAPAGDAAARRALEDIAMVGDLAGWDALRIERGVPRFGIDFDEKTYPQEAALENVAVSFDKGCYLGQEVVCMLEMRGHVKRKLVPIVVKRDAGGLPPPPRGAVVTDEGGAPVGEVTSAVASPTLGTIIALAMVKRASAQTGSRVLVGGATAEVVDRPA